MSEAAASLEKTKSGYRIVWASQNVVFDISGVGEKGWQNDLSAEVTIRTTSPGTFPLLFFGRINLLSVSAKSTLVRELKNKLEVDWPTILEATFYQVIGEHRKGDPVVVLGQKPMSAAPAYRLWPLMPDRLPTIIFGEGGACKSYLALLFALIVQSGWPTLQLNPIQGNVLYVDYETSEEEMNERLQALAKGLEMTKVPPVLYRLSSRPIADDVSQLQSLIAEHNIQMLIVDSLGLACGGNLIDAEPSIALFRALRQLGVASLLNDHVAKNTLQASKTPFGSVYKINYARSVWEAKKTQEMGRSEVRVGLFHRKVNRGPLRIPLGFLISFREAPGGYTETITFQRQDVQDDTELSQFIPVKDRIIHELENGAMSVKELASELEKSEGNIRTYLGRLQDRVVHLQNGKWGLTAKVNEELIPF